MVVCSNYFQTCTGVMKGRSTSSPNWREETPSIVDDDGVEEGFPPDRFSKKFFNFIHHLHVLAHRGERTC